MALDTLSTRTVATVGAPQVSSLPELAKTICLEALAKALRNYHAYADDEALLALDLRRPAALEAIKDGLAQGAARALAACDAQVQAVYAYDPSANPDNESGEERPFDATLHLLVVVTALSATLPAFILALDRALTESLKEWPALAFQAYTSILDVNVISEEEVRQRAGYARLLSSLFAPPIEIWRR
jgi:hypothetical protein